ncbi:RnfABCDGE type electron transport complex subunit D [uncultured Brachyspira sp.]|uniref:RnfABCDGE type electron transport complex subunit D n=1 Tax=uncultured Brachyspira sp. TaxID=221953 RepID=UPI0025E150F7|nr:RnfABCDGE type electron transport complex subunit D [uncultured Brachyspira sp.]
MKFYTESSPHIKDGDTTNKIMLRVIIALLPAVIYSIILFGYRVAVLYLVSIITCILSTIIVKKARKKPLIPDYAVSVTAILLVMTLPPSSTVTMVVIGGVVAIVFAKEVFGGLGSNIFNPALVGRAFLQVAFPAQMTIYAPPKNVPFLGVFENILKDLNLTVSGATQSLDAVSALTSATPLTFLKFNSIDFGGSLFSQIQIESHYYLQMLLGSTAGAIGETSFLLLLIGGIYLLITNTIDWRIPLGMFASLVFVSLLFCLAMPGKIASPIYQVLAGGFALGAFFMATDMVTCPSSHLGAWIYAVLIGSVLAILRTFGSSPEYMMYSILIGNMFMPLISMFTRPMTVGKRELININKANAQKEGGK